MRPCVRHAARRAIPADLSPGGARRHFRAFAHGQKVYVVAARRGHFRHHHCERRQVVPLRGPIAVGRYHLPPTLARRQTHRPNSNRIKTSLCLPPTCRRQRLRLFARSFHDRVRPPRRPSRPLSSQPKITPVSGIGPTSDEVASEWVSCCLLISAHLRLSVVNAVSLTLQMLVVILAGLSE